MKAQLRALFGRDQGVVDARGAVSQIWELDEERDKPKGEVALLPDTPNPAAAERRPPAAPELGPQEPNDMKSNGLAEPLSPQNFERGAEPATSQPRPSGAEETAAPREAQAAPGLATTQSLYTQAELCFGRFDQRIRELSVLLESAEALGHTAAQELEPLLEARQSQRALAQLCISRLDQPIGQLTVTLGPVEALCQSAARELEPLRTLQRQLAGFAATFATMKARWEQLEPLAGKFESMKSLCQQMAYIPSEFRAHVLLLAKSLEPARALYVRAAELASTLEPVNELAGQFAELLEAFPEALPDGENPSAIPDNSRGKQKLILFQPGS